MKSNPLNRISLALAGLALAATFALAVPSAVGAEAKGTITPNYKDADLSQVIEAVSAVTGKNFIVDPRVKAQVTMLSATPMSPAAFYEAFLSILQVHGFVAVPSGNLIKILPDANARQVPGNDLPSKVSATSDELVTQVIAVKNVSAAQLVPILRPLIPQNGHLAAYPASNMLIISDRASNVNRMARIIERIDSSNDEAVDVIPMEHASASEVVRVVNSLTAGGGAEAGAPASKLVADDRTNSVLISGEASQRLRLKTLVAHLDTPLVAGGDTQVRYLRYANAEKIAAKLKEQVTGIAQATPSSSSGSGAPGGAVPGAISASSLMGGGGSGTGEKGVIIWAEPQTNAIVVTAPPKIMRQVMSIVDRLDIRRAQVLVEAILVEMQVDKSIDLGVNWAVGKRDSQGNLLPAAGFISPVDGVGLGEVAAGIANPSSVTSLPTGLTMGVGRLAASGTSWTALIRAIGGTGNTNIIATPSILTLDNEEAEIKIAQEVPFVTGQYTTNSTTTTPTTGVVNPFTTVTRQEVGNILKITPQINEGDTVALKISQEASSIAASSQQVSKTDLITNKRTITTKVMVENGGIIVLGGLISDQVTESKTQVPFLGSIPVLGNLFKTTSVQKTKTNLMVFIRPRILRDGVDAAIETNAKYNYIRDQEHQVNDGKVPWMPSEHQPAAPPLEKLVPPNLLNPAHEAAPPGTTPAQRAEASSNAAAARETATDAAPAAPAIAPGAGAASPPPPPPPAPGH